MHKESDNNWHTLAHDALEQAQQHQAHVSFKLLPCCIAADEDAGALQSKVQELEEWRTGL